MIDYHSIELDDCWDDFDSGFWFLCDDCLNMILIDYHWIESNDSYSLVLTVVDN